MTTVKTKDLENAIKSVCSVTGSSEVSFICNKELSVFSAADGRYAKVLVATGVEGKWRCRLDATPIMPLLKGAGDVEIEADGNALSVRAKNTKAELKLLEYEQPPTMERSGESEISPKLQAAITERIEQVAISDVHDAKLANFVFIRLNAEGLTVCRFDTYHLALVNDKRVKSKTEMDFMIDVDSFLTIQRFSGGSPYQFSLGSAVRAWSDAFELQLPLVQSEGQENLDTALAFSKSLKADWKLKVSVKDFTEALEKMLPVYETNSNVSIKSAKTGVTLSISSDVGRLSTTIKATVSGTMGEAKLDPNLALDTLSCIDADQPVELGVNDNLIFSKARNDDGQTTTYAFVLVA